MRRCLRLLACLPLLATTACVADAIAGPDLTPEPLPVAAAQAAPGATQKAAPEPGTIHLVFRCASGIPVGSGEPLLIVDGVPWGGSREELVALDIATIEVLAPEQLAATSGARGVIIINTRAGASRRPAKPVARRDARQ